MDDPRGMMKGNHMAPSSYSVRNDPLESAVPSDYSYLYGEVGTWFLLSRGIH